MRKVRKQFNDVIFGGQGTGKTTFQVELIIEYAEKNPDKRVLLILPDDSEDKFDPIEEVAYRDVRRVKGIRKVIVDNMNIFTDLYNWHVNDKHPQYTGRFRGLIIADDAGVLIKRRDENVLKFMRRRRQANADIITSFHGLRNEIPPSFFGYVNRMVIFNTTDSPEETIKLLPPNKQMEFIQVYERVQKIAQTNPYYKEEFILRNIY